MLIVETVELTKRFGEFTANDGIGLQVKQGEIKAIVGENGAGKSTLMNMLYGLLTPTSGKILIRGEEQHFSSPSDAIRVGLGMVHQHFKLVPSLTVAENIVLGVEERIHSKVGRLPFIDRRKQLADVQATIDRFGMDLNAGDRVADLSIGLKQRVEIMKMLYRDVEILILDEPTAVLTPQEVDALIVTLKELQSLGKTIIVITHKLSEVMQLSDSVTIIKRGKVVADLQTARTNQRELAQLMVGRDVVLSLERHERDCSGHPIVYAVRGLSTVDEQGKQVLDDIDLTVRQGEVLGIAGVEGNGQSELLKVLTGLMTVTAGSVTLGDRDLTNAWPMTIRDAGVGVIHEDRYQHGLCRELSISDNVIAGYHERPDVCRNGLLRRRQIDAKRDRLIEGYDIRVADPAGAVSQLSGGNAQKVIIAREFDPAPTLLIAAQPTRGVDVGSIEFIHRQILELRDQGTAVLLISSELSEIMSLSDRIAVMYRGSVIGEVTDVGNATTTEIGLLMAGIVEPAEAGR